MRWSSPSATCWKITGNWQHDTPGFFELTSGAVACPYDRRQYILAVHAREMTRARLWCKADHVLRSEGTEVTTLSRRKILRISGLSQTCDRGTATDECDGGCRKRRAF